MRATPHTTGERSNTANRSEEAHLDIKPGNIAKHHSSISELPM